MAESGVLPAGAERLPGRLSVFGAPPQPVEVTIVTLGPGRRISRAAAALGICWGLAFPAVFLPVAHFVLVPGLLLAGPVLAVIQLRQRRRVVRIHGTCPRCGVTQDFPPGGGLRTRRTVDCPQCRNDLTLLVDLGDGTAAGDHAAPQSAA
ncbi:MAG TPA: hypothetical protein VFC42_05810 [Methylomirabilota bacterium]|nr:hypothetical protein [Methylomirabilota bacterium]